jgi:hypothetical protein
MATKRRKGYDHGYQSVAHNEEVFQGYAEWARARLGRQLTSDDEQIRRAAEDMARQCGIPLFSPVPERSPDDAPQERPKRQRRKRAPKQLLMLHWLERGRP